MNSFGYYAACFVGGEYVELGPYEKASDAISICAKALSEFEIIYHDGDGLKTVYP